MRTYYSQFPVSMLKTVYLSQWTVTAVPFSHLRYVLQLLANITSSLPEQISSTADSENKDKHINQI